MNKKILFSLSLIAAMAAIVVGGTMAYLSDTETSVGNVFTAGAIDLKIDSTCHFDGMICSQVSGTTGYIWVEESEHSSTYPELIGRPCTCSWDVASWVDGTALFNFGDVKPGDRGEDTISLHIDSNPAWVCAEITDVAQNENGCNTPEAKVDSTCDNPGPDQGELFSSLFFNIWMDNGTGDGYEACNNRRDSNEVYLVQNAPATNLKYPIVDSQHGGQPIKDSCIGVEWYVPNEVNNIAQTDSVTGNLKFNAIQARNNDRFVCWTPEPTCGDGNVGEGETCEYPNTTSNSYCSQTTTGCVGVKTGTRDALGNCNGLCGCEETPFTNPVCVKGSCGAGCAVDEDCIDTDPNTTDTCNVDTCQCNNVYVPSCGNGVLDPNEQCDDHNTTSGDGCSETCQNEYAYITVIKQVENNGVGTKVAADFQMTIDGHNVDQNTPSSVGAGARTVSEADSMGYVMSFSGDCDTSGIVMAEYNKTKTCTVTNTYPYGKLTVVKIVKNDSGGDAVITDFTLKIDGQTVVSGAAKNVAPGTRRVTETGKYGYQATFTGDCDSAGYVNISAGDNKVCTITNDDIAPNLTLIKVVDNQTVDPDIFNLTIDGNFVPSGSSNPVIANVPHTISETVLPHYKWVSISGNPKCPSVLNGTITLGLAESAVCTITNTHLPE